MILALRSTVMNSQVSGLWTMQAVSMFVGCLSYTRAICSY